MKAFFIAAVFALLIFSPKLFAQSASSIPSLDQVDRITISSHGGWTLDLRPDGSGKLIYGSNGGDVARIPKQTFSFQDVYNLLVPHLSANYPVKKAISVFLDVKGLSPGTPTYALYLDDRRIIKQIMSDARDKAIPLDKDRFNDLVKKYPPVPDDSQ